VSAEASVAKTQRRVVDMQPECLIGSDTGPFLPVFDQFIPSPGSTTPSALLVRRGDIEQGFGYETW
jgi:hypothetical protein